MLEEKLPIFLINTLLLHIPLLALTHRWNYGGTELQRNELILVGLGNLRFLQVNPGWALSCFVLIYNLTVTIVSQKYQELSLQLETSE
jgi:hypothetical protein